MSKGTLKEYFDQKTRQWTFAGALLTSLCVVPFIWFQVRDSAENRVEQVAALSSQAFRPMLLQGHIRDAQFQLAEALKLQQGEFVAVLQPDFKPAYPLPAFNPEGGRRDDFQRCIQSVCWGPLLGSLKTLQPIYFDREKKQLFGYLSLTMIPRVDFDGIAVLLLFIALVYLLIGIRLKQALSESASWIGNKLNQWTEEILGVPFQASGRGEVQVPFHDLQPVQRAINGLKFQVKALTAEAEETAKLSMLKELAHDLKQPFARFRNHKYAVLRAIEMGQSPEEIDLKRLDHSEKEIGEFIEQLNSLQDTDEVLVCQPEVVAKSLIDEFQQNHHLISARGIRLKFLASKSIPAIRFSEKKLRRVLDNLIANAIHASDEQSEVSIRLRMVGRRPQLTVQDCGRGIKKELVPQVWNLDFTTRPGIGSGWGLPIVKRLCGRFGASIRLSSREGRGTRVEIDFLIADSVSLRSTSAERRLELGAIYGK